MDWSVGALGGSHGFITLLSAELPSAEYISAVTASTWSSYNSVYQIGDILYGQTRYGSVQTGMLRTSQEGGAARVIDSILKFGVHETEEGLKPAKAVISYSDDKVLAWEARKVRSSSKIIGPPLMSVMFYVPGLENPLISWGGSLQHTMMRRLALRHCVTSSSVGKTRLRVLLNHASLREI